MATNSSSFEPEGQDRFSLLWLEEGEYYFRDYNCHLRRAPDQTCVRPSSSSHRQVRHHPVSTALTPVGLQGCRAPQGLQQLSLLCATTGVRAQHKDTVPSGLQHPEVPLYGAELPPLIT